MKKILVTFLIATMMFTCLTGCGTSGKVEAVANDDKQAEEESVPEANSDPIQSDSGNPIVSIDIENYGVITVELDSQAAPITVENFLKLVNEGFYDGLTFHRIIDGFMMQGGDPTGTGMGGSEETIKGEFANNGVDNKLSHTKGAVSMARSQDPDSASSQFFIVDEDSTFLDNDYATFGYVIDGIDVVDEICTTAQVVDGNGTVEPENQPIIKSIKVVE